MCQDLRRHLRLLEHHPGNIGQYLNGPTFYVNQDSQYQQQDMQMQTYFAGDPAMQTTSYSSFYDSPPQYGNTAQAYTVQADESSMEASSCTSSDYGPEFDPIADDQGNVVTPTIEKAESNPAYGEQVFLQYTRFKKAWRRFEHKPTRRFRRFCKRKGKARGKSLRSFLSSSTNKDMDSFFQRNFNKRYQGKPSGKRQRKGKYQVTSKFNNSQDTYFGKLRLKNPTGKDGKPLTCFNCGSDTHLKKDCKAPPKQTGKGN